MEDTTTPSSPSRIHAWLFQIPSPSPIPSPIPDSPLQPTSYPKTLLARLSYGEISPRPFGDAGVTGDGRQIQSSAVPFPQGNSGFSFPYSASSSSFLHSLMLCRCRRDCIPPPLEIHTEDTRSGQLLQQQEAAALHIDRESATLTNNTSFSAHLGTAGPTRPQEEKECGPGRVPHPVHGLLAGSEPLGAPVRASAAYLLPAIGDTKPTTGNCISSLASRPQPQPQPQHSSPTRGPTGSRSSSASSTNTRSISPSTSIISTPTSIRSISPSTSIISTPTSIRTSSSDDEDDYDSYCSPDVFSIGFSIMDNLSDLGLPHACCSCQECLAWLNNVGEFEEESDRAFAARYPLVFLSGEDEEADWENASQASQESVSSPCFID